MGHSRPGLISAVLLLLVVAGCPKAATPPPSTDRAATSISASASVSIPPPPTAPPLATSPSPVEVRILSGPKFEIVSTGSAAVDLSREVRIEPEPDSGRYPIGPTIQLTEKCDRAAVAVVVDAGTCMSLPAGGKITPVPWTGYDCDSQCPRPCRANAYLGPGRYRYVVKSCDGTRRWESAFFDLPAYKP